MQDNTSTIPEPQDVKPDSVIVKKEKPKIQKRRQFRPNQRLQDSQGQVYYTDQNCNVRRADGGKMSKAEKKAAKRARQKMRNG